jgi:MerR family transcriptional regulator/heat shock protein HspR
VTSPELPVIRHGSSQPVYGISVAAELTGVHPQMLRTYEARGLIDPHRTDGGTRRYSGDDVTRVLRITGLLLTGLNLEGVQQVLALEEETKQLRAEISRLRAERAGDEGRPEPQ